MLATAPLAPSPTIMGSSTEHMYRALSDPLVPSPRQFKKHKMLPRPAHDLDLAPDAAAPARAASDAYRLVLDASYALSSSAATQPPSSPSAASANTVRPTSSRRLASTSSSTGPDPPPTPPAHSHSRASSSSQPTLDPAPPAPTLAGPVQLLHPPPPLSLRKPPVTPPDQRSPPTPDVTPPQPQTAAVKTVRSQPPHGEQSSNGPTPTDSRNDSFKTAQEEPFSSEDDRSRSTPLRSRTTSAHTSQTTILRIPEMPTAPVAQPAPAAQPVLGVPQLTPRTMNEFRQFDGEWDSTQQPQNHNHEQQATQLLMDSSRQLKHRNHEQPGPQPHVDSARQLKDRNHEQHSDHPQMDLRQLKQDRNYELQQDGARPQVVVSKRKRPVPKTPIITSSPTSRREVVEDHIVTPTAATRAARHLHLRDNAVEASPVSSSARSASETSASVDARRSSATSARSSSSAVVEVMVMHGTAPPPQRRRTLRHVKKQNLLRQPRQVPDRSSGGSFDGHRRLPQPQRKPSPVARDRSRPPSTQTTSNHPVGDTRARREIWSSGGIPVVVVPDRRSSNRSKSREPSLRSTSSRRSKRSASVGSPQRARGSLDTARTDSLSRGRNWTKNAGDERTMDFAPAIPPRSSSLSAATSRNVSRTTSLTTESIRAHNALLRREDEAKSSKVVAPSRSVTESTPVVNPALEPVPTISPAVASVPVFSPTTTQGSPRRSGEAQFRDSPLSPMIDQYPIEDALSAKKYSSRNTPFSVTSVATTGTVPEVSEAFAVHMYPHQNSSVVMVNHSGRPSDLSSTERAEILPQLLPTITTTGTQAQPPATPPEQLTTTQDVDSPLRNPRAPPQPPTHPPQFNLIPATPSGATPATESDKKLGNLFETSPPRRESILKRTFSRRRRNSVEYPPTTAKPPGKLTRTFSLSRSLGLDSKTRPAPDADIDGEVAPRRARREPVEREKLHPLWRPQLDDDDGSACEYGDSCPHHRKRDTIYRYPPVDNRPRPPPKRSLSARMKNTFAIMPVRSDDRHYYPAVEDSAGWPERRTIRRTPSGNLRVMERRASLDSPLVSPRLFRGQSEPLRPSTSTDKSRPPMFWRPGALRRAETADAGTPPRRTRRFSLSDRLEDIPSIPRILNEKRREKRTQELRQMISAPKEVRDGVGEVIRRGNSWGKEAVKANPSDF